MLIVTEDTTEGCPGDGVLLTFGADDNQDGTLEAAETDGSTTICDGARGTNGAPGTSGPNVLFTAVGKGEARFFDRATRLVGRRRIERRVESICANPDMQEPPGRAP